MDFKDHYQILGVEKSATADGIKKAYRKLARKYHPDVSKEKDAEAHMKEVNEANEVLSDTEKRVAYDQLGNNYIAGQEFNPPPNWDAGFEYAGRGQSNQTDGDFSDFFASLFRQPAGAGFSNGRGSASQITGEDRHAKVMISLNDNYIGASRDITMQTSTLDAQCRAILKEHTLKVNIPKGIKSAQKIRLTGQGAQGYLGGKAVDLYLEVHFKPDTNYRIGGRDVYETIPVTPWEAALGASINVPTPSGAVDVKMPPYSKAGKNYALKRVAFQRTNQVLLLVIYILC
jgi:curved DNA-binding protein